MPLDQIGGFLALDSPQAGEISQRLRTLGVFTDYRGEILRLGPAPYLSDRQLQNAVQILGNVVKELSKET